MSNFLQLAQSLRQEARIAGVGPATTANQSGEAARLVTWINNAWRDIQRASNQWLWMTKEFEGALVDDQGEYLPNEVGIPDPVRDYDKDSFSLYNTARGLQDETEIFYMPWDQFKLMYRRGFRQKARPLHWTLTPAKKIAFGPIPETDYTLKGEYHKQATRLNVDGDEPDMPEEYHQLIVWVALTKYAASEAAPEVFAFAESERVRMLAELRLTQLPELLLAGPLE